MIKRWSLDCGPPATTSSVALGTSQCVSAHVSVSVGWGATDHASLDELTPRTQQSPTQNYDVLQARVQSRLSTGKRATGGGPGTSFRESYPGGITRNTHNSFSNVGDLIGNSVPKFFIGGLVT